MLAKALSSAILGIEAYVVEVEVNIARGLPSFTTVGLPEVAVRESKERVKAAIQNSGYAFPDDRITVNLAPANIKKEGTGFDLPIALGILAASETLPPAALAQYLILGELSLDGRIKAVNGALSVALAAKRLGAKGVIVPLANGPEAAIVEEIDIYAAETVGQVVDFLQGRSQIQSFSNDGTPLGGSTQDTGLDFAEVSGQEHVKRALEVAAAGGHNALMIGPPGAGKTMLAQRLPTILPPMTLAEAIETTKVYSVIGMLQEGQALVRHRPFRAPHHTISDAGLIGGGQIPRPGEVSLAHNGVLFLDELPEFKKHVLEVLRQPLENQQVTIARASSTLTYPAAFMLVVAMNPCPCGYYGDSRHECRCTHQQIHRYRSKISGPLLDRIDIHLEVPAVSYQELKSASPTSSSDSMRVRVQTARAQQQRRLARTAISCNAHMRSRHLKKWCAIDENARCLLEEAMNKLGLSARAHSRIIKIARTLADLDGRNHIEPEHISEAIQYRTLDRRYLRMD